MGFKQMNDKLPVLAILGGTGDLGTGLARRWAVAGYHVIIGSRSQDKAEVALADLRRVMVERGVSCINVRAMDNLAAAKAADIVALTVPFSHQKSTLEVVRSALKDKILIDVTVPLVPPKVARVQLPPEGSAGQIAQALLGEEVSVVSAFQNVAAHHLQEGRGLDCDVLVCGDSKEARAEVVKLVEAAGMRGIHAGSIANAAAVEALTSLLIFINRQYKCHAGIRVTGLEQGVLGWTKRSYAASSTFHPTIKKGRAQMFVKDVANSREALLRQLLASAPRTEHLTEWQKSLEQMCYQWAPQGLQLGFHLTNMATLSLFFMTAYVSALKRPVPAAESDTPFRRNHVRPHW